MTKYQQETILLALIPVTETFLWFGLIYHFRYRILLFWFLALPGVILHETCHFLVALLTFGKPGIPRIFPRRVPGGYALGRVPIHNLRWYNAWPIGMAPFLLVPAGYWLWHHGFVVSPTWPALLWDTGIAYLLATIALETWPSRVDWRLALPSFLIWGLVGSCLWIVSCL